MREQVLYLSAAVLALALAAPAGAQTSPSPSGMQPTMTQVAPTQQVTKKPGHHPEIHQAMHKIEHATQDLQQAADDYGGHKAAAIKLLQQAHQELEAALAYARQNKLP